MTTNYVSQYTCFFIVLGYEVHILSVELTWITLLITVATVQFFIQKNLMNLYLYV